MTVVRYLPIVEIRRRPDARPLDEATVASLADSIKEIGLRCPINVRLVDDEYELIAGSHRLAAFERLGETEILVIEIVEDDLRAELAMIDENLCRSELSPADRTAQTTRRKAIYERLHPETRHGENLGNARVANLATRDTGICHIERAPSFAAATAKSTGQSERAVRRDAERGGKIVAEALGLIRGTRLDTGAYLDRLKGLSPDEQVAAAERDLACGSAGRSAGATAAQVTAKSPAVAADPADRHRHLITLLDVLGVIDPADIIASCPARERAALCSRLSHLIDVFHQIMEGVAP